MEENKYKQRENSLSPKVYILPIKSPEHFSVYFSRSNWKGKQIFPTCFKLVQLRTDDLTVWPCSYYSIPNRNEIMLWYVSKKDKLMWWKSEAWRKVSYIFATRIVVHGESWTSRENHFVDFSPEKKGLLRAADQSRARGRFLVKIFQNKYLFFPSNDFFFCYNYN